MVSSYTIIHRPIFPGWSSALPYVVVLVALDGHPNVRMAANLFGARPDELHTGLLVHACFPSTAETTLLGFVPTR